MKTQMWSCSHHTSPLPLSSFPLSYLIPEHVFRRQIISALVSEQIKPKVLLKTRVKQENATHSTSLRGSCLAEQVLSACCRCSRKEEKRAAQKFYRTRVLCWEIWSCLSEINIELNGPDAQLFCIKKYFMWSLFSTFSSSMHFFICVTRTHT